MTLTHAELRRIKDRFMVAVSPRHSQGVAIDVYWLPERRDITTRVQVTHDGRARKRLPPDAIHVGTYKTGAKAAYLVEDLGAMRG